MFKGVVKLQQKNADIHSIFLFFFMFT